MSAHRFNQIIGSVLVLLAVASVLQGINVDRRFKAAIAARIECTNTLRIQQQEFNAQLSDNAWNNAQLVASIKVLVTTPVERRTPEQYQQLAKDFDRYLAGAQHSIDESHIARKKEIRC